jgi:hypothetical protein
VGNPIWGFGQMEAHRCGLTAVVSSAEGRAPVRGRRGTPGRGGAQGGGEGVDLARVDRSTMSWPWQRKAGDAELMRVHRLLTCPKVGSTCSAVTRGSWAIASGS